MYRLVRGENPEEVSRSLVEFLMGKIGGCLERKGLARVGLAGGRTPRLAYRMFSESFKEWDRLLIFPTDERFVPSEDERSNYRMLRETLGEKARVYRIKTELPPEEACRDFDGTLSEAGPLDLVLLGLGADGHTASLFPGAPCEPCGRNACISRSPDGLLRVSMSLECINGASTVAFLVLGEEKRSALEKLLRGEEVPAAGVRRDAILFTDLDARG